MTKSAHFGSAPYNRGPFNRNGSGSSIRMTAGASLEAEADCRFMANGNMAGSSNLSVDTRRLLLSAASFSGSASLYAAAVRSRLAALAADLSTELSIEVQAWETLTLPVDLPSGKKLEINSETFDVLLDGQSILSQYTGEFPSIYPGIVELEYTDGSNSRKMRISVEFTEQFL